MSQDNGLFTLTQGSKRTGSTVHALQNRVLNGRLIGYQLGGWHGKYSIPHSELDRLLTPVGVK